MSVPLPGGMDMVRLIRRAAVVLWWIACCVPSANGDPREYRLTASSREDEATGCSNCRLTITDPTMSGLINLRFIKLENESFYKDSGHVFTFTEGCDGTGQQTTLYAYSFLKSPFNPEASVEFQFHESCITLEVTSTKGFRIQYRAIDYPAQDIILVVDSSNAIQAVDLLSVTAFTSQPSVINGVHRSRGDISAVAFYPPTMTLVIAYRAERVISRYQVTDWNQSISFIDDIVTDVGEVSSVVIDPDNGELYWSDARRGTIHSSGLDGLSPGIVLTQLRSPTNLILDHHGRFLYWIEVDDNSNRIIRRATTDGTGGQNCSIGADLIALSDQDSKIHWLGASEDAIGEYSWEDNNSCVRVPTLGELGHQSNDMRNLVMREDILMWTEQRVIYGKALDDDDTLHPYDLRTPVKLLLLSKFTEQPSANPREYRLTASSREDEATGCSNCRLTITDPTMRGSINLRFIKLENESFYNESGHVFTFTEGCDGTGQQTTLYAYSFLKSPFNPEASVEYQFHESCITLEVTSTEGFRIRYRAITYPAQDIMLVVDSSNAIRAVDLLSVTAFTSQPSVINDVHRSRGDISAVAFYPPTMTLVIAYRVESGVISRYQVTDWNQSISSIDDIVTNVGEVSSVVIDPDNGELYWSDAGRGTIHSSGLDGLSPGIVLTQLRSPTNLILDHHGGYLYWIEVDDSSHRIIRRATTDGTRGQNCSIGADLIALSDQDSKLHWLGASEDALGEYSWEDDDSCVRMTKFGDLGHQSNDIRNLVMREDILMWTEQRSIYGKALDDDTLHAYDLMIPLKLLLLSKFTEQPSADNGSMEPIITPPPTTARSVTQTEISVKIPMSSDGTSPGDASLTSLYKYIVLVTAVGIVLCAVVLVVLLTFSKESHERTISPKVRRTPELAPLSRNASDSSENSSV